MFECLVYIGEPQPTSPPLRLSFAAVPRQGERVFFKSRQDMEVADAYQVQRVAHMATEGLIGSEIHLIVAPVTSPSLK